MFELFLHNKVKAWSKKASSESRIKLMKKNVRVGELEGLRVESILNKYIQKIPPNEFRGNIF
jgi:hypothetical protein